MAGGVGLGAAAAAILAASTRRSLHANVPLYSEAVAFTAGTGEIARELWHGAGAEPVAALMPGTRVLVGAPGAESLAARTRAFVAGASQADPGAGLLAELEESALLDLHSLTWALPSPVAAWTPYWRYTWPRDTAHVIDALASRRQAEWALELLGQLAALQRPDGTFEARYIPGTTRAPDGRPPQFDGVGWFLWAAARVLAPLLPAPLSPALSRALSRAALALMEATAGPSRLPAPSPDYWERPERRLTLGTAAMTLAGLHAAARLAEVGALEVPATPALLARARDVEAAIARKFGRRGFQRYAHGGGVDAGLLMLLPPYRTFSPGDSPLDDALMRGVGSLTARVDQAFLRMARPAGGVAPAESWKRDGITWTPQTAMFAQAYAHLEQPARSRELLSWLARHRTSAGALSEKVLADGSPAAVAPLSWTAALVLATLTALDEADGR